MPSEGDRFERHVGRWWRSFAVALFLLIPFDLLTTLFAVTKHGPTVEANPIMRWLLQQGLFAAAAVNIGVACLAVVLFHVALGRIRRAPPSYHGALARVVHVWIGGLLVAGTVVVANNLLLLV